MVARDRKLTGKDRTFTSETKLKTNVYYLIVIALTGSSGKGLFVLN
jgi:hypothetical protein